MDVEPICIQETKQKRSRRIGHGNWDHETSSKRGQSGGFTTKFSTRLLNKALQALASGGGCVIPITVLYDNKKMKRRNVQALRDDKSSVLIEIYKSK